MATNIDQIIDGRPRATTANSTFAIGGVSCSADSFVVNRSLVFQIKFCGKSPALRVATNRYRQLQKRQDRDSSTD